MFREILIFKIMPTLLQINIASNWGSTGKIMEQIGLCAQEHNWDSYVTYGRKDYHNPSKNHVIRIGSILDAYEHYAENLFLDNEGLASRFSTKSFLNKVDEIQPDIVHLHIIHDHYLNYPMLFSYLAKRKIPVVWTQHDQWATTGHCYYIPDDCERWKDECYDCPISNCFSLDQSRRNFKLKKQFTSVLPSLTIVPVSEWLGEHLRQSHLKGRPIQVIHNGIDINTFSPQKMDVRKYLGIQENKKIILGVAALWDRRKGLTDFYELSKRLSVEEYAIVIVGRLIDKRLFMEDGCQMVFVDRTQNVSELAQLYSSATVFVNPTYQDNFPTTNLESIACGTPVITYNTGGSPEAIDEKTGIVVEQGNVDAIAEAIYKLNDCPLFSEDCRKRAEDYFDNKKCFVKYMELYEKLIQHNEVLR